MSHAGKHYKVYLGRTKSVRKRVKDYGCAFQIHSPNDFKMRLFQTFASKQWPGATLDLFFARCGESQIKAKETKLIRKLVPLLNSLLPPSVNERETVSDAYLEYCGSVLKRTLDEVKTKTV